MTGDTLPKVIEPFWVFRNTVFLLFFLYVKYDEKQEQPELECFFEKVAYFQRRIRSFTDTVYMCGIVVYLFVIIREMT